MWELAIRALSVVGGLGFIAAVITALAMRWKIRAEAGKLGADASQVLAKTSAELVTEVRADMREMKESHQLEMRQVTAEVRALRRHVGVLEGLLRVNGIPVPEFAWPPPIAGA